MGLSRTVSEMNNNFSRKSQNFRTPVYLTPPTEGFPLQLGICAWDQKTRMMGLPGQERSLTISFAVWVQYTNMQDRHWLTAKCLYIAMRGQNPWL